MEHIKLEILSLYVKDLAFSNPGAPFSFQGPRPDLDLNVDVHARHINQNQFEVSIRIRADARSLGQTQFTCELTYAGIFAIENATQENINQIVLIECPKQLFPFARRVLSDVVRDGGFPPLQIDPIKFEDLFRK